MGLPVIIQMLKLADQDVKVLHIEPTDFCNAACPQCLREVDPLFDKKDVHHLTIDQIKEIISEDVIKNLNKLYMCGVYGDPAAGKHTLEIIKYVRSINSTITIGMNTNGGLRDTTWWKDLAQIMWQAGDYPKDYVVFSLDGLSDTNQIYRIGTDWSKIMDNAQAFITAGGLAHWEMLVFEHNQHQVVEAEQLAKKLGFKWFRAKVSKRFKIFPVNFLQPPKGWVDPVVLQGQINCHSIKTSSIYLSARGKLYPCSWLGRNTEYTLDQFENVQKTWTSNIPNPICFNNCTSNEFGSSFTNQWQREIEF